LTGLPFGVLGYIHGGVGGAQQAIVGDAVLGVKGDAHACRAKQDVSLDSKRRVEAALQPLSDIDR